ncbi:MAG TPA: hypothetical protein VFL57_14930 [Bryobacteraceae bacterium]|nr:hypothetical protein [Bryobacteraceae bacterium]
MDAGFDHILLVVPGPDQLGFMRFWQEQLRPALAEHKNHVKQRGSIPAGTSGTDRVEEPHTGRRDNEH